MTITLNIYLANPKSNRINMIRFIQGFTLLFFFISGVSQSTAQDTLKLKSGEVYIVKILLVADKEINYKLTNELEGPHYSIKKNKVSKIILQSGTVIEIADQRKISKYRSERDKDFIAFENKLNKIKWEALTLLTNDFCIGYERGIDEKNSIEIKISKIGLGFEAIDDEDQGEGYYVKLGLKVISTLYSTQKLILGNYIKPEIGYSSFNVRNYKYTSTTIMTVFGIEAPLSGSLYLDVYCGLGVANNKRSPLKGIVFNGNSSGSGGNYSNNRFYNYSNLALSNKGDFNICVSAAFTLGFAF